MSIKGLSLGVLCTGGLLAGGLGWLQPVSAAAEAEARPAPTVRSGKAHRAPQHPVTACKKKGKLAEPAWPPGLPFPRQDA